ncbi:hypothetical protein Y1Q_0010368 [Alligator mississippiensis]|uniref:Uncharacterized protein n=1 Tax=Alligator mississippiensis TaxID=8496 RepID=A0A151MPF3_ALLMI|nr:hypothetical protein Y1Q_0010368 [Alligator mississippiensis]
MESVCGPDPSISLLERASHRAPFPGQCASFDGVYLLRVVSHTNNRRNEELDLANTLLTVAVQLIPKL